MSSSTFKILFVVRKNRLSKDGSAMISIRVTIEGESLEFSSKMKIYPDIWDADAGRAKGRTRAATDINEALDKITSRLHTKYKQQEDKYGYVTPELLRK